MRRQARKDKTVTPAELCTECGYLSDRAWDVEDGATPVKAGDISLCFNCGRATIFTGDLRRREMTAAEHDALPLQTKVILVEARRYCTRALGIDLARRGGRT